MITAAPKETCKFYERGLHSFGLQWGNIPERCSEVSWCTVSRGATSAVRPGGLKMLCSPDPLILQTAQLLMRNYICLRDKVKSLACGHIRN